MNEGAPALTACVVAWNAVGRIGPLLRSLEAERVEVVVVDNASSDGTAELVRREHPAVRLIASPTNLGYAAGQARAAREAREGALLFLNDDVVVPPGSIAALLAELAAHTECVAIGPALVGDDGMAQRSAGPLPSFGAALHRVRWLRWTRLFRRAHEAFRRAPLPPAGPVECLMGAAILVRREAYEQEPWDPGFPFGLEDADLSARLGQLGPLRFAPEVKLQHAGGVASAGNPARVVRGYEVGWVRYVAKRQGATPAMLLALATIMDLPLRATLLALRALGLVLRGRGSDARTAAAQARAMAWTAITGWPVLLREAEQARGLTLARVAAGTVPLAVTAVMAAAYWPILRTVSPQLAVDAAAQAAFLTTDDAHRFRADHRIAEQGSDPWGGSWGFSSSMKLPGARAPGGSHVVCMDLFRACAPWVAMVAQGHWLLLFAGTAAFGLVVLSSPRLTVDLEVCLFLIAIAPAALAAQPLATYVIEHPWLVSEAWRGAFGLRATPTMAIVAVGMGLRLHLRPEPSDPLSAIPARNP